LSETTQHPALAQALTQGAQALGIALSPAQEAQLMQFLQLLARWNRVYNLTAVRDEAEMIPQHLLDSLAALPPLRRWLAHRPSPRVLDVGSGGGLPGVVFSVLHPDWTVTCVDAVTKKVSFIRQVAAELGLKHLQAHHGRVERWHPEPPAFDVITSRAFASLADFTQWTAHLLAPDGVWMALKGRVPDDEIAALPREVEVFHVEPLHVPHLGAERCLVWLKKKEST
jgi:16S rRNA (guanine527-N7)-methyltransferase